MIIPQVPRLFNIEVARGDLAGYTHVVIQAINPAVLSADANDTSAGTGARTVLISGLDDSYVQQTESVTMNGVTPVVTTRTDWFRITSVRVTSSGSGQENAGAITIRVSGGGLTRSLIRVGQSQTFNGFYTVPAGKMLLVQYSQGIIPKNQDVKFQSRILIDGTNTWIAGPDLPIYQNDVSTLFNAVPTIPEKTDIRLTAQSTNTSVSVAQLVEGILANDTAMDTFRGIW